MSKKNETKNNIVKAAMELCFTKGIHEVSVRAICEAAGISKNTFYQYFQNKEDVFGDSFASSDEEKMSALPSIFLNFDSPLEQLWEFIKIDINRQMALGPNLISHFAVMNIMHDSFNIEEEEKLTPSLAIALAMVKKMQRCSEIKNMSDPFLLVKTICGSIVGIDLRWAKTKGAFDFKKEVYDQVMAIFQPVNEIKNY